MSMKKLNIILLFVLVISILVSGCGLVAQKKSDEEIIQEIDSKMSFDIYDFSINDYYIEKDESKELDIVKLNNTSFDYLYKELSAQLSLNDGHFFLSMLNGWSDQLFFRNTVIDSKSDIGLTNRENNYYCIFENEDSVKLFIFFYDYSNEDIWQSYGHYITSGSRKYTNPATNYLSSINPIDR